MIAWTRRSGLMPEKPLRMAAIPPECFRVLSSRMAPKMIHRIATVRINPCRVEARTRVKVMSQATRAISAVTRKTMGMATLAAMRMPISRMPASMSGTKAIKARVVSVMVLGSLVVSLFVISVVSKLAVSRRGKARTRRHDKPTSEIVLDWDIGQTNVVLTTPRPIILQIYCLTVG